MKTIFFGGRMKINIIKVKKFLFLLGFFTIISILGSCSQSDTTLDGTGIAADGFLYKARVFLDCNNNFIENANEKVVLTGENGEFDLNTATTPPSETELLTCPVVVDATDSKRVVDTDDKDANGNPITLDQAGREGFKLSSPAGQYAFISPLTTIAHVVDEEKEIDKLKKSLGISDADLEKLGLSLEEVLFKNYLDKESLSEDAQAVLDKIAKKARIFAQVMETKQNKTNNEMNLCLGQKCPEMVVESLANFSNIYHQLEQQGDLFDEEGNFKGNFEEVYEVVENVEADHDDDKIEFSREYHGEEIDMEDFLVLSILRPEVGSPCTDLGPKTDFHFLFSIVNPEFDPNSANFINRITAIYPNAAMVYESYKNVNSGTLKSCKEFFSKGVDKTDTFVQLIEFDINNFITNEATSVLYRGTMDPNNANAAVSLTKHYYKSFLVGIPNGGDITEKCKNSKEEDTVHEEEDTVHEEEDTIHEEEDTVFESCSNMDMFGFSPFVEATGEHADTKTLSYDVNEMTITLDGVSFIPLLESTEKISRVLSEMGESDREDGDEYPSGSESGH